MNFEAHARAFAALTGLCGLMVFSANSAWCQVLQWQTIAGIQVLGDVVGVGTPGVGSGAITGGAPWNTLGGFAKVNLNNGRVKFDVNGLILAVGSASQVGLSGLPIGTPAGVTAVKGTLVCNVTGDQGSSSLSVDTPVTTLDAQGNADFKGGFTSSIPSECSINSASDDAFLIRIGSGPFAGAWIAFGAVLSVQ